MSLWSRPHFLPSPNLAEVHIAIFSDSTMDGLAVSRSRHGVPDDPVRFPFRMDSYVRSKSRRLFTETENPEFLALAKDQGLDVVALNKAPYQILVRQRVADPSDAEHLRMMWGLVRAVCDTIDVHGVLDLHARRWWSGAELLAVKPDGDMDVRLEVTTNVRDSVRAGFGFVCHTRGLRKFARPDLIVPHMTRQDSLHADELLHGLARHLALGGQIAPGERVVSGRFEGVAEVYVPGKNGPELDLGNSALVLLREDLVRV